MTGSERQHLRQLIDHHQRRKVALEDAPFQVATCAGCGVRQNEYVDDCETCRDRRRARQRAQQRREERLRSQMFNGRCQLCGGQATGPYCRAHDWAAA